MDKMLRQINVLHIAKTQFTNTFYMKSSSLQRYIPSQSQVLETITSTIPSSPAGLTHERDVVVISITCLNIT